jgi:TP901 family phage tail tape measure protein
VKNLALEIKAFLNQSDMKKVDKQYSQFIKDLTNKYKITVRVDTNGLKQVQSQVQKSFNDMGNNFTQMQNKVTNATKPMTKGVDDLGKSLKATHGHSNSFFGDFGTAMEKFPIWIAASAIFMNTIHKIGEAFQFTVEQSKLFTNLQMEMTNTSLNYGEITTTANDYAIAMNSTTDSVMKAISVFGTYTATMDEILEKSQAAIILSNITGQGIEQSADAIMGTLEQFELGANSAEHIVDIIAGTARMLQVDYPVAVEQISEGLRTVGSVAKEQQVSIETTSAMLGTLIEKTRRSGTESSNALKTIFSRFSRFGEETDPETYDRLEEKLYDIGIAMKDVTTGAMIPTDKVLQSLSEKWDNLTDATKNNIVELGAGVYRRNFFIALMKNYDEVLKNTEAAINSEGVAMSKQEIFAKSLQASINNLKTTWEKLYLDTLSPETLQRWTNLGTEILTVVDILGVANIAVVGLGVAFLVNAEKVNKAILAIKALNPEIAITVGLISALMLAIGLYGKHQQEMYDNSIKNAKSLKEESTRTNELMKSLSELQGKQNLSNEERKKLGELQAELQKIYPSIFSNLDLEKTKYEDLETAVRNATAAKREQAIQDVMIQKDRINQEIKNMQEAQERWSLKGFDNVNYDKQIAEKRQQLQELNDALMFGSSSDAIEMGRLGYHATSPEADNNGDKENGGGGGNKKDPEKAYKGLYNVVRDLNFELSKQNEIISQTDESKQIPLLEKRNEMLKIQQDNLHALNDARRAEQATLPKTSERYQELEDKIQSTSLEWWALDSAQKNNIKTMEQITKKAEELNKKTLEEQTKNLEDVQKQVIDMIKKRHEIERDEAEKTKEEIIKGYKEELESYRRNVEEQIDEIDRLRDAEDFNDSQDDITNEITKLQNERNSLLAAAKDNDLTAQNRIEEIDKQLAEKSKNLTDLQQDREDELRKQNLQDRLNEKETKIQDAIDLAEAEWEIEKAKYEKLLEQGNLNAEANKALTTNMVTDINGKMVTVAEAFKTFSDRFGETLGTLGKNIQTEFIDKLNKANTLINAMNGVNINNNSSGSTVPQFADGGVNNFTGAAILHGTPSSVETIFNATQGKKLYEFINNLPMMPNYNMPKVATVGGNSSMTIGDIIIQTQSVDTNSVGDITNQVMHNINREYAKNGGNWKPFR